MLERGEVVKLEKVVWVDCEVVCSCVGMGGFFLFDF